MTESLEQEIRALRSLLGSPRDPEGRAFAPLADAYRRAGDFRHALEVLREGLERHPGFVPGHLVAARLYLEAGLLEEAELAARRAVELDEGNTVAWGLLAGVLEARGALAQARDARARLAGLEGAAPPAGAEALPEPEPEPEPVMELADLAPEPEPVMELADLAPEPEPEPEPVMELAELAPEPEPEPVMELADLAPEPEPEPVLELADLAPDDLPSDELPESEPLVTRTLADLYARQGLTERALAVYRQLLEVSPGDHALRRRIQELEGPAVAAAAADAPGEPGQDVAETEPAWAGAAEEVEVETPFAWTAPREPEEPSPEQPSAGAVFARMLGWEPRP